MPAQALFEFQEAERIYDELSLVVSISGPGIFDRLKKLPTTTDEKCIELSNTIGDLYAKLHRLYTYYAKLVPSFKIFSDWMKLHSDMKSIVNQGQNLSDLVDFSKMPTGIEKLWKSKGDDVEDFLEEMKNKALDMYLDLDLPRTEQEYMDLMENLPEMRILWKKNCEEVIKIYIDHGFLNVENVLLRSEQRSVAP